MYPGKARWDTISKEAILYGVYRHFELRAFLRKTEHANLLGVSPESVSGRELTRIWVAVLKAKVAPDDEIIRVS